MKFGTLKSPALAWVTTITAGVMWCLATAVLIFGGTHRWSGLALFVIMSGSLFLGIASLINQRRRRKGLPDRF